MLLVQSQPRLILVLCRQQWQWNNICRLEERESPSSSSLTTTAANYNEDEGDSDSKRNDNARGTTLRWRKTTTATALTFVSDLIKQMLASVATLIAELSIISDYLTWLLVFLSFRLVLASERELYLIRVSFLVKDRVVIWQRVIDFW